MIARLVLSRGRFKTADGKIGVAQEKIKGQRGKLPVQPLGYVNCTKVIYRGALERKSVFRDVRIKANLDLLFSVKAK